MKLKVNYKYLEGLTKRLKALSFKTYMASEIINNYKKKRETNRSSFASNEEFL